MNGCPEKARPGTGWKAFATKNFSYFLLVPKLLLGSAKGCEAPASHIITKK
jgi:hypothetical protein